MAESVDLGGAMKLCKRGGVCRLDSGGKVISCTNFVGDDEIDSIGKSLADKPKKRCNLAKDGLPMSIKNGLGLRKCKFKEKIQEETIVWR